jgi:hypothetical protein
MLNAVKEWALVWTLIITYVYIFLYVCLICALIWSLTKIHVFSQGNKPLFLQWGRNKSTFTYIVFYEKFNIILLRNKETNQYLLRYGGTNIFKTPPPNKYQANINIATEKQANIYIAKGEASQCLPSYVKIS